MPGLLVARRNSQPITSILGLSSLGLTLLDPDYQLKDSRANKHVQIDTCHTSYMSMFYLILSKWVKLSVLKLKQLRFFIWSISSTYSKSEFVIFRHPASPKSNPADTNPHIFTLMSWPWLHGCSKITTWTFPKRGVPPNHPFQWGFSLQTIYFGVPLFLETSISFSGQVYTCHPLKIINQWVITSLTDLQ